MDVAKAVFDLTIDEYRRLHRCDRLIDRIRTCTSTRQRETEQGSSNSHTNFNYFSRWIAGLCGKLCEYERTPANGFRPLPGRSCWRQVLLRRVSLRAWFNRNLFALPTSTVRLRISQQTNTLPITYRASSICIFGLIVILLRYTVLRLVEKNDRLYRAVMSKRTDKRVARNFASEIEKLGRRVTRRWRLTRWDVTTQRVETFSIEKSIDLFSCWHCGRLTCTTLRVSWQVGCTFHRLELSHHCPCCVTQHTPLLRTSRTWNATNEPANRTIRYYGLLLRTVRFAINTYHAVHWRLTKNANVPCFLFFPVSLKHCRPFSLSKKEQFTKLFLVYETSTNGQTVPFKRYLKSLPDFSTFRASDVTSAYRISIVIGSSIEYFEFREIAGHFVGSSDYIRTMTTVGHNDRVITAA